MVVGHFLVLTLLCSCADRQYWQQELRTDELLGPLQLPTNFPTHVDAMTELPDKRIMLISGNNVYTTQIDDVTKVITIFPKVSCGWKNG